MKRKPLRITRAYFRVSANRYASKGYHPDFRVFGIMPSARTEKPHLLFFSSYAGYIHARPLGNHSGDAAIRPADWRALVKRAPIQADPLDRDGQVTITPEIEAAVRLAAAHWADSAEEQMADACPSWQDAIQSKLDSVTFGEEPLS